MRINKAQFVEQFSNKKIDVADLRRDSEISTTQKNKLVQADINGDGFIQGSNELNRLFEKVDHFDNDGDRNTLEINNNSHSLHLKQALERSSEPLSPSQAPSSNDRLNTLLQSNPQIRTKQDAVNFFMRRNQNNWAAADRDAQRHGLRLGELTQDRNAPLRSNTQPAPAPVQPMPPSQPTPPSTPTPNLPTPLQPAPARGPVALQNTSRMTEGQKYDYYKGLIEDGGGRFNNGTNKRNLLALRTETNTHTNGGRGVYDDKMVMVWKDSQGNKRVREYTANTEPSAQYEGRQGTDVNGDGRRDLGRVPAGYYEYSRSRSSRFGDILRPTNTINAERDTNHDGFFRDGRFGDSGYSMLFHKGGNTNTGSAGCQTFSSSEWSRFWRDLNTNGNPGTVGYTIVNI